MVWTEAFTVSVDATQLLFKANNPIVWTARSLNSSKEEKLVRKNNQRETISEVLNMSPTSHGQEAEIQSYSDHNWKTETYWFCSGCSFGASHIQLWASAFRSLHMINQIQLFLLQMYRWKWCLSFKNWEHYSWSRSRNS